METQTKAPRAIQERTAQKATRAIRAKRGLKAILHPRLRRYLHPVSRRRSNLLRENLGGPEVLQAVQAGL